MAQPQTHYADHRVTISAPVEVVFDLLSRATGWPQFFGPTIHVEQIERNGSQERLQLWATANGEVRSWTSRRQLDPDAKRIAFQQESPQAPLRSMGGEWLLEPMSDSKTAVDLKHDFSAVDDDDKNVSWIAEATDRNSRAELAALKATAERHDQLDQLSFSFEDSVSIQGDIEDVYQFLYRAQEWPERIPHVPRLELREDTPNVQQMEMDTRGPDGTVHTTQSVRVCFPPTKIAYKQLAMPALMSAHTGLWLLRQDADGVTATSTHNVTINPDAVTEVLGPDATVDDARKLVHGALSQNSTTTLEHAKAFAEGRARA